MTDRVMLQAEVSGTLISVRTVSFDLKSPHCLCLCQNYFDDLQRRGRVVVDDARSSVVLRLDEKHDRLEFRFTWLSGSGFYGDEETEQTFAICWSKFRAFLYGCRQPGGPKTYKAISLETFEDHPKLTFIGNHKSLQDAIKNKKVRHKLGKALTNCFNRSGADEVRLSNGSMPYSFIFQEITDGQERRRGKLTLHCEDYIDQAYYAIHTRV